MPCFFFCFFSIISHWNPQSNQSPLNKAVFIAVKVVKVPKPQVWTCKSDKHWQYHIFDTQSWGKAWNWGTMPLVSDLSDVQPVSPIALKTAKTPQSFGLSQCNRVKCMQQDYYLRCWSIRTPKNHLSQMENYFSSQNDVPPRLLVFTCPTRKSMIFGSKYLRISGRLWSNCPSVFSNCMFKCLSLLATCPYKG